MTGTFISFAGQSKAQSTRLLDLRSSLLDLQRQMATQKRSDDFSGLGVDTGTVQRLRTEGNETSAYMKTIDRISIRTRIMSEAMTEAVDVAREVVNSMRLQIREGDIEIGAVRTIAQENLRFLQELVNSTNNGTYVFAGNDVRNPPLDNMATLNSNMQTEVTDWLNGTQTSNQLIGDVQSMSGTALGYSTSLQSAGDVLVKIDSNVEVNYTVKGDGNGFSDIIKGVALMANLQDPDPAVDVGTKAEFFQIYDEIITTVSQGIQNLDRENFNLSSKNSLMNNIQERHIKDKGILETILAKTENVDLSETIVKLQAVESQLTASYETTRVVSELTLINFI